MFDAQLQKHCLRNRICPFRAWENTKATTVLQTLKLFWFQYKLSYSSNCKVSKPVITSVFSRDPKGTYPFRKAVFLLAGIKRLQSFYVAAFPPSPIWRSERRRRMQREEGNKGRKKGERGKGALLCCFRRNANAAKRTRSRLSLLAPSQSKWIPFRPLLFGTQTHNKAADKVARLDGLLGQALSVQSSFTPNVV